MMGSPALPPPPDDPAAHPGARPPTAGHAPHPHPHPPAATTTTASVLLVPRARVGRVIGRAGETIRALQTYAGASIQIAQEVDPCRVVLAGPPPAVALAECLVRDIVAGCFKGFALLRQQAAAGAEGRVEARPAYMPGYGLVPHTQAAVVTVRWLLLEGRGEEGGGGCRVRADGEGCEEEKRGGRRTHPGGPAARRRRAMHTRDGSRVVCAWSAGGPRRRSAAGAPGAHLSPPRQHRERVAALPHVRRALPPSPAPPAHARAGPGPARPPPWMGS
jgi:hypothetical protein